MCHVIIANHICHVIIANHMYHVIIANHMCHVIIANQTVIQLKEIRTQTQNHFSLLFCLASSQFSSVFFQFYSFHTERHTFLYIEKERTNI